MTGLTEAVPAARVRPIRVGRRRGRAGAIVLLGVLLISCGSGVPSGGERPEAGATVAGPTGGSATPPTSNQLPANEFPGTVDAFRQPMLFTRQAFRDPAAENVEAIVFLLPAGWQAQAGVQWMPEWERLAHLQTTVFDPTTGITIDWLPIQDFIWFEPPVGFSAPIGGNYQGKAYVPPVTDPQEFVANFWMPGPLFHLRDASLVNIVQVPAVADEFARQFGGPAEAFAYRMRYEYALGGQAWEEDIFLALLYTSANGITSWYVNFAYAVRAPAGQIDRNAGTISTIVASRTSTAEWEGIYRLVVQLFIRGIQQQMADTEAFGRLLAQYRAESAALQQQVTQERQASQDRIADLRGQSLQGVATYIDPFSQSLVQLPFGWNQYWVNSQGQYAVSDPGFDPSGFFGGGWQQLQQRP